MNSDCAKFNEQVIITECLLKCIAPTCSRYNQDVEDLRKKSSDGGTVETEIPVRAVVSVPAKYDRCGPTNLIRYATAKNLRENDEENEICTIDQQNLA